MLDGSSTGVTSEAAKAGVPEGSPLLLARTLTFGHVDEPSPAAPELPADGLKPSPEAPLELVPYGAPEAHPGVDLPNDKSSSLNKSTAAERTAACLNAAKAARLAAKGGEATKMESEGTKGEKLSESAFDKNNVYKDGIYWKFLD